MINVNIDLYLHNVMHYAAAIGLLTQQLQEFSNVHNKVATNCVYSCRHMVELHNEKDFEEPTCWPSASSQGLCANTEAFSLKKTSLRWEFPGFVDGQNLVHLH